MLPVLLMIITGVKWVVIIDALLSWVMPAENFPRSLTTQLTAPLYAPIRAILKPERSGGFDLSPMIVFVILLMLESALARSVY
jgi:uncharacterized protein YggT (Ycf19 family)